MLGKAFLAEAIRAWAKGWLPTEAAAELLIAHRGWLERAARAVCHAAGRRVQVVAEEGR